MEAVLTIQPSELAEIIRCKSERVLIVDARTFCEYNTNHIVNSVNVWSSKIRKKRLQQNSISVHDFLQQACHMSVPDLSFSEVVVYDQSAKSPRIVPPDTFLHVLLTKLSASFNKVFLLQGGFLDFQAQFYEMCEDSSQKGFLLTSFSQPCLPSANTGPTKVLPFLFLGSQNDANNRQLLLEHNISHELNVSTSCPKPDFLAESHFFRIAVNDNFSAKLLPHFGDAFRFIDMVREVGGRVLVHCLAGISRSPTVVISYVMKHMHLHYDEAYRFVKSRRPTISPNINFVGQLLELDLHLFGNRVLFRSPPDLTPPSPLSPHGDLLAPSLLLKSSSSSCLESVADAAPSPSPSASFPPFHLNRSLPSLQLNKPGGGGGARHHHHHQPPLPLSPPSSPPQDLASLLSSFSLQDGSSSSYVSSRLPSSPVSPPGSSSCSWGGRRERVLQIKTEEEEPCESSVESCRRRRKDFESSKTDSAFSGDVEENESSGSTYVLYSKVIPRVESRGSVNLIGSNDFESKSTDVRITKETDLESHENRNLILSNKPKIESKCESTQLEKELPIEFDKNVEVTCQADTNQGNNLESSLKVVVDVESSSPEALRQTDKLSSPSDRPTSKPSSPSDRPTLKSTQPDLAAKTSPPKKDPPDSIPPKAVRSPSFKRTEPPPPPQQQHHLPRSYSSSETYINTRTRLERQAAINSGGGSSTRKSFSSDEVGRGFQGAPSFGPPPPPPPGPPSSHGKDHYVTTQDLARCDSWSTSGLGSEISDWDSLHDEAGSTLTEEAMGPFDAVFAEVFPGDGLCPPSKEAFGFPRAPPLESRTALTQEERPRHPKAELTRSLPIQMKTEPGALGPLEGHSQSGPKAGPAPFLSEDAPRPCHTPRPVSLPGVSGTYNSDSNLTADMGVDLEENGDWLKGGFRIFDFSPPGPRRGHILFEHPPVNPRTMGEDVKYIMTWYKMDSSSSYPPTPLSPPPCSPLLPSPKEKEAFIFTLPQKKSCCHSPADIDAQLRRHFSSPDPVLLPDRMEPVVVLPDLGSCSPPVSAKRERWQWWDREFNRKIDRIKRNVSRASWDPSMGGEEDSEEGAEPEKMAGFHLAQELMQSMEDLLEREICDIKRQASVLSSRFGLPVTASRLEIPGNTCPSDTGSPTCGGELGGPFATTEIFLPTHKSCSLPYMTPECLATSDLPCAKGFQGGLTGASDHGEPSNRAKSEPPGSLVESLYRVKSCPGISQGKGDVVPCLRGSDVTFRVVVPRRSPGSKRYSCSALDYHPPSRPVFESCPDMRSLHPFGREGAPEAVGPSPSTSFSRLLKVS